MQGAEEIYFLWIHWQLCFTNRPLPPKGSHRHHQEHETMAKEAETGGISGERLRSFIQRIEKLEEDKAAVGEDLKEVYAECKGVGFDTKIIRQIVRLRKMEVEKRRENDELLDLYKAAIGMEE
jgi:uncharacterized protein (UPF0335 family)